jgi:hypothetical protein
VAGGRPGGQGGGETTGGTGGKGHNSAPESVLDQVTRYAGYWNMEFSGADEGGATTGGIPGGFGSHRAGTKGQAIYIALVVADIVVTIVTFGQSVAAKGGIVAYTKSGLAGAKAAFSGLRRLLTREGLTVAFGVLKKAGSSGVGVVAVALGAIRRRPGLLRRAPKLPKAGEALFVGAYNVSRRGNLRTGLNALFTPHHAVQNAVSSVSHATGITINIPKSLHPGTSSFRRAVNTSLSLRQHLARDVWELRKPLKGAFDPQLVRQQLQELIRQNKALYHL